MFWRPPKIGDEKMEKDIKKLKALFDDGSSRSILALSLIDKAEFMEATLKDLQKKVQENGVVTKMCQGAYNIDRANPALQAYNVTIKNYTSIVKQLNDMLPKGNQADNFEDDDL